MKLKICQWQIADYPDRYFTGLYENETGGILMAKNGAKPANESIEQIRDIIFGEEKRIRHAADQVHIPEKNFKSRKNHYY